MEPARRADPARVNPFAAPETESAPMIGEFADTSEAHLAERGTRLAGAILDTLLYAGAMVPGLIVLGLTEEKEVIAVVMMVLPLVVLAIYQMILVSTTGQTLAKKWLKMKIVKVDGSPVNFVSAVVLRTWVIAGLGLVPFVGNFVGIIDACMIFGEERQCLHDKIAGTKVIDVTSSSNY